MSGPPERTTDTERRRATVLFADITGFTTLNERLDPEEAYEIVTGCLKLLDGIARKHGGSVDKYLGDAVMAVFGVPLAIDDAPKAAINAAIEMRRRVRTFNEEHRVRWPLEIHSGINTGLMISGDVSGPIHREFAVMGDAVNIAARLKDLAPKGEIWIGEETWRSTRDEFEMARMAPLPLKGKNEKVQVYEVRSEHERIHRRVPDSSSLLWSKLEGRDVELGRITEEIASLTESGTGGVLAVVAEAGLGKSRLILEVRERCSGDPPLWLEGRSASVGSALGYHPIRDLLRGWAGIGSAVDDEAALLALDEALAGLGLDDDDHQPFLASLMGIPLPPSQRRRIERIEGEALEKLILKATGDLLRAAAADRPLVLVFEDLHWADQSTIQLLCDLVSLTETLPILVLAVCRPRFPETSDCFLQHVAEDCEARFTRVELEPLDALASERLIDNLLVGGDVPAKLRGVIESKAAGNPFFIGEVVRILIDQGALAFRGRQLVALRPVDEIEIPGTVQEVVMARIDRLELRAKHVLQVVSVAGGATPHEILEEIVSDAHFESDLARLIELDLLEDHEQAGQRVYPFKHPLIQEVCYEGILLATRRDLHLRTAVALESEVPETTPGFHGMLAYHFGRGNDLESAEEYLFKAGDDAARVAASSEALHYFQEASRIYLELHGKDADPEKVASLETKVALANYHRGRQLEAIDHINRALALRGIPIPKGRGSLLRRTGGGIAVVLSKLYLPFLQRKLPSATDRDREVADLMFKRARSQTTTDPLRFLSDTIEAMRFNTTVDPATVPGAAGMYAGSAGLFAFSGVFGVSRRFLEEARRQLDDGVVGEVFLLRFFEFVHAFLEGPDVAGVPEIDPELLERNVREGGLWDVCMYLGLLIKKKVYQGAFSEAAEWIEYLGKLEVLYAYRVARENYQGGEAFLAVETGRYDEGIAAAERYFTENREVLPNLLALATRGKAEALAGRLDAASETLARADLLVASQTRIPPMHLSAHHRTHLIVEVAAIAAALAKGDGSEASVHRKAARVSARLARGTARSVAWRRPEVLRLIARLEALTGHHRKALGHLARAIEAAEGAGLRPELARAHLAAARLLASGSRVSGRGSAEHQKRGEALLDELGLSHELELGEIWTAG